MRVRIIAFASAADALGTGETTVEIPAGSRVADLRDILAVTAPGLHSLWDRLAIAVDDDLADPGLELEEGCEVALLPPVSGGSGGDPRARLQEQAISIPDLIQEVSAPECGAALLFLGTVRSGSGDRTVARLTYTAHETLALRALEKIVRELEEANPGLRMAIHHRLGTAEVGDVTVGIAAASPHRHLAYEASRAALERLKREAPIWKREEYTDGSASWREEEPLRT